MIFAEEIITKRKTELTTTKQIETRVKRQVVLEDGRVVDDSGPIVETNTTEDTDKQETESTEVGFWSGWYYDKTKKKFKNSWKYIVLKFWLKNYVILLFALILFVLSQRRNVGQPDVVDGPKALEHINSNANNDVTETKLVPRPKDGLVREINTNVKVSREEKKQRVETEDVHHLGDFSDQVSDLIYFIVFSFFCPFNIYVFMQHINKATQRLILINKA